jgi:hypothetical protein
VALPVLTSEVAIAEEEDGEEEEDRTQMKKK